MLLNASIKSLTHIFLFQLPNLQIINTNKNTGSHWLIPSRVVEVHPDSIELFRGVGIDDPNSGEFEAHCLRIFNQVDHLVGLLHNKEAVREASKHLGSQHAVRPGVLGRYFEVHQEYLNYNFNNYNT